MSNELKHIAMAALIAVVSSCTRGDADDGITESSQPQAILFATAEADGSRAVTAGSIGTARLKTVGEGNGFGVFAYYGDGQDFTSSLTPQFMYNQNVYWSGTEWTYSPLKYWPNETLAAGAAEDDKLSFFAYAPYVELPPAGSWGITSVSANSVAGAPRITYVAGTTPATSVDLLWGVDGSGLPHLNLTKPAVSESVDFVFRHALARLDFTVMAADDIPAGATLTVNSVTITPAAFHAQGVLCLNNSIADTPQWESLSGTLAPLSGTLNTAITSSPGVSADVAKPLFGDGDDCFMVIPATGDITIAVNYTITYAGGSSRTVTPEQTEEALTLEAGSRYTLQLMLGVEEASLKATIVPWVETAPVDAEFVRN